MNKKTNSLIFMAVATVVNIALLFAFVVAGIVLVSFIPFSEENAGLFSMAVFIVFLVAIILSFLIYTKLVKWATVKFNLEDKLDPLFTPKKNRRDRRE